MSLRRLCDHQSSVDTLLSRIGDEPYTFALVDTAGKEDLLGLRTLDYPQTDVFLVFARIGLASTYQNAERMWIPEIAHHCPGVPLIIVGIGSHDDDILLERAKKQRLPTEPRAYTAMGENMAKKLGAVMYVECNIFTQEGLKDVFDEVCSPALELCEDMGTTHADP